MDCQYELQCKVNCNSAETISIERWKQLEIKTKNWKFEKFENLFERTDWEKERSWKVARVWKFLHHIII